MLIIRFLSGLRSLRAWMKWCPVLCLELRRLSRVASAWLKWRHRQYQQWPLLFAAVGDPRLSDEEALGILNRFYSTYENCKCCVDALFSRRLLARDRITKETLPCWRRVFYRWALTVKCSVHDIESRHGRNTSHLKKRTDHGNFQATAVIDDAKLQSRQTLKSVPAVAHPFLP